MRTVTSLRLSASIAAAAALLTLGACGEGSTAPRALSAPEGANRVLTTATVGATGNRTANQGEVELCKDGTSGSFSVTTSGIATAATYNLTAGQCVVVAVSTTMNALTVSITEAASTTTTLVGVATTTIGTALIGGADEISTGTESGPTVNVSGINQYHGKLYIFTNRPNTRTLRSCNYTQGYYKNHADAITATLAFGFANGSTYVTKVGGVLVLKAGGSTYTTAQLIELYNTPPAGDQNIAYLHQLVTAELNFIATGIASTAVKNELTTNTGNTDLLDTYNNNNHCD